MRSFALLLLLALVPIAGCNQQTPSDDADAASNDDESTVVYTTFYPTTFLAERIGGDVVEVVNPVPADADPIFFEPSPEIINAYQSAALIVVNGADFEKWVAQAPLPRSRIVDTAAAFEDAFLKYESATHSHGPAGEHTHEGVDGHTWLDPQLAIRQADAIRAAFSARWPDHAATFDTNYRGLRESIAALDLQFANLTDSLAGATLVANHPAYNYLARRYGWEISNLDLDPDSDDAAAAVAAVREALASAPDEGVRIMLWEAAPTEVVDNALSRELGVMSVEFAPAESIDPDAAAAGETYLSIMAANIARLTEATTTSGAAP